MPRAALALLALSMFTAQVLAQEVLRETLADGSVVERTVRVGADGEPVDHGPYQRTSPGGQVVASGEYSDGLRSGRWRFHRPDGEPLANGTFRKGLRQGTWTFCHPNGAKHSKGGFAGGRRDGDWTSWTPEGDVEPVRRPARPPRRCPWNCSTRPWTWAPRGRATSRRASSAARAA